MSKRNKKKNNKKQGSYAADAIKSVNTSRLPSVRYFDQDPDYWSQSFLSRAATRLLYSLSAFVIVGSFFDAYTPAPLWMQILMGACVGLAVLLFRLAYPAGIGVVYKWIMEGMAEAAKEMEAQGKKPAISSKEITDKLKSQEKIDKMRKDIAKKNIKEKENQKEE